MTDTAPPPAPSPAPVPGADQPSVPKKAPNVIGLVALGIAVLTFLLAVIPPTSFVAWLPAVAAIVLAIIGLTRKGRAKGTSIAAIIVAPIAWIIAIVVALSATVMAVDSAIKEGSGDVTITEEVVPGAEGGTAEEPATAGIGTPVTSGSKMTYTVTGITCGLDKVGSEYYPEVASGQFCELKATIANGGGEGFDMYPSNVKGFIDGAEYEPNDVASKFGQDTFSTTINPGLTIEAVLYFDIPKDKMLQTVEFGEAFTFDDPVAISLQ